MEAEGSRNVESEWLDEVRRAMSERVTEPKEKEFEQSTSQAAQVIAKKRNWSAPGPDRKANFRWKKVGALYAVVAESFQAITQGDWEIPLWFTEGKTMLIPQSGGILSENQRPITCLNAIYKWFTSCLLKSVDMHLVAYLDNLLIDGMVC